MKTMKEPKEGWAQHWGKPGGTRYGRENCRHLWRIRTDGYEEYCAPLICVKCGAFACHCVFNKWKTPPSFKTLHKGECASNADINGEWINPYIERDA